MSTPWGLFTSAIQRKETTATLYYPDGTPFENAYIARFCLLVKWDKRNIYGVTHVNIQKYIDYVKRQGHHVVWFEQVDKILQTGILMIDYNNCEEYR